MNICFVVNKHQTIYFAEIAKRLEKKGHAVFWLSPSARWARWLQKNQSVPASRVLDITRYASEWKDVNPTDFRPSESLARLEGPGRPTINNIILMCRALNVLPRGTALAYLDTVQSHAEAFLRDNSIDVCFGEPTW